MIAVKPVALKSLEKEQTDLAVFVYEDAGVAGAKALPPAAKTALAAKLKDEGFKGGPKEIARVELNVLGHSRRVFAVGLGKKKAAGSEAFRRSAGALVGAVRGKRSAVAVLCSENAQAVVEGLTLASYRYEEYKKGDEDKLQSLTLAVQDAGARNAVEKACAKAALYAEAVALARDLVNRGPSDKTPASLAELAETFAGSGVSVSVIDRAKAEEMGMGSFLGVSRGSAQPPVMVHMIYKPKGAKKRVAVVGKGITFDSGGLSLKPAASMEDMKCDMAGAASVLGVFKVIARLKPAAEVHGIFAAAYNMPGPDAYKPGDVLKAMNGKTIEVWNTDAEGRLVLADALCLAVKQDPHAIVDLATLTGAVVVALGSKVAGIMGNDRKLIAQLQAAGKRADESFCELPLVEDYKDNIKGNIAELLNISKARGEAGSIIGGLFLQEFVDGKPWAHLDIAGTAFSGADGPYAPKGGTGSPVRTLLEWLESL